MHNIQEKTANILPNLHVYSDLLRKVQLCQSPPYPIVRNNSEIGKPPLSPLSENHQKLDNSPSDDHKNLNIGRLK